MFGFLGNPNLQETRVLASENHQKRPPPETPRLCRMEEHEIAKLHFPRASLLARTWVCRANTHIFFRIPRSIAFLGCCHPMRPTRTAARHIKVTCSIVLLSPELYLARTLLVAPGLTRSNVRYERRSDRTLQVAPGSKGRPLGAPFVAAGRSSFHQMSQAKGSHTGENWMRHTRDRNGPRKNHVTCI